MALVLRQLANTGLASSESWWRRHVEAYRQPGHSVVFGVRPVGAFAGSSKSARTLLLPASRKMCMYEFGLSMEDSAG